MLALRNSRRSAHAPRRALYKPPVEPLEGRMMLSGNVVTTPTGTPNSPAEPAPTLIVEGDPLDNEVLIKKGNTPDEIIVSGLNGTLVNGSTQEWHYQGVRQLFVSMDGGNDVVKLTDLKLSATPGPAGGPFEGVALFDVQIDGGTGDDQINVSNTTFNAEADPTSASSVSMSIIGDATDSTTAPTTGNDWIDVNDTTLIADGGVAATGVLTIAGDSNAGGTITGGNDHINVSNTTLRASSADMLGSAFGQVAIFGDQNIADTGQTSTIGEGNDWIDVSNTSIDVNNAMGQAVVVVAVYGDFNQAQAGGTATIGNFAAKTGGNDTISLTNTTVSASGANFTDITDVVDVRGDQSISLGGTADIGGGNDNISIKNFAASASGINTTNETDLSVFGDGDVRGSLLVTSRIGAGDDIISLTNDDIFAAGNPNNRATVEINTDDFNDQGEVGTIVGQGDDNLTVASFLLEASTQSDVQIQTQKGIDFVDIHNVRIGGLGVDTGTGNDELDILNSQWGGIGNITMGQGNDVLKMNSNTFITTTADGGPLDYDILYAHGNTGVLVPTNFEEVHIS